MKSTRRSASAPPSPPVGPDLTSLVDVTFQLLVFLLVVNDIAARTDEPLPLPEARCATEARPGEEAVVVNVLGGAEEDGPRIRMGGATLRLPELAAALRTVADLHRPVAEPGAASTATVRIRADRAAPWSHVRAVLTECAREDVRIVRVQFSTRSPDPEGER